jgi:DNA polymerase (family X)
MPDLDASAVAKLLTEFGQRSALRGGNPYRARAYGRAAESLLALTTPLSDLIAQGRLRDIPGVGAAIAESSAGSMRPDRTPRSTPCERKSPKACSTC